MLLESEKTGRIMHEYISIQYKYFSADGVGHAFWDFYRISYLIFRTLIKPDIISILSKKELNNLIENMIGYTRKGCLALSQPVLTVVMSQN